MTVTILINSNGLGTQSPAQAIMLHEGKINIEYDYFFDLFADTGNETEDTYKFKKQYEEYLSFNNYPMLITIKRNVPYDSLLDEYTDKGIIPTRSFRHCTHKWKILTVRKFVRNFMRQKKIKLVDVKVLMMIGFTGDEITRVRDSDVKYITNIFPLLSYDRKTILIEMNSRGLYPSKSGCWFCPFLSSKKFFNYVKNRPDHYFKVLKMEDKALLRNNKMTLFNKPLRKLKPSDYNDEDNCNTGYCFI